MKVINQAKSQIQSDALNAWFLRGCKGTLQLCTGAGKTYCALRAIKWLFENKSDARVLIICPTEIIRDDTFPKEFKKWKMSSLLKKVDIQCIQTVYKWKDEVFDLVVADEIHNYLPDYDDYSSKLYEYHKFFDNNQIDRTLGLSALIPKDKVKVCRKVAPVAYTLTTDKGVKLGVVSPYIEFNIPVKMNLQEEKAFRKIQMSYFQLERKLGGFNAFSNSSSIMKKFKGVSKSKMSHKEKEEYNDAIMFWKVMQKRKKFLYELPSKVKAVHDLIDTVGISKSVIFSQSVMFADLLAFKREDIVQYHSKLKDRSEAMKLFTDGRTKVNHLSTCMAVNEGMDLPKLPTIIIASRTSGAKNHIQRRGRCLRFEEGKTSYVFNLYIADSQDQKWLIKSQSTTDPNNIINVKNIEEVKEIIEESK